MQRNSPKLKGVGVKHRWLLSPCLVNRKILDDANDDVEKKPQIIFKQLTLLIFCFLLLNYFQESFTADFLLSIFQSWSSGSDCDPPMLWMASPLTQRNF